MKNFSSLIILLFPILSFSQTRIDNDTLYYNNLKFTKGSDLYFGIGSNMENKSFNFIYTSPKSFAYPAMKLSSSFANLKMKIYDFKEVNSKKRGDKFFIILSGGAMTKYWCEIDQALQSKEVIVAGFNGNTATQAPAQQMSTADELKKWKDLYDTKAITQEEYEAKKKKLLEQ